MSFSLVYKQENSDGNCCYFGYQFDKAYVKAHFSNEIKKKLVDYPGTRELVESFDDIVETDFDRDVLKKILRLAFEKFEMWKIGEAFCEFFLEKEFKVRFWYNHLRDLKNPKASPTGPDLVGFIDINEDTIFVFGEVKTSEDERSPPQVFYGKTGFKNQINELKNNKTISYNLIRYLGFKVSNLPKTDPFCKDYRSALKIYIKKRNRIHLCGLLVRDTKCNCKDLESGYNNLKNITHKDMIIKLIGLYIPIKMKKWEQMMGGIN